MQAAVQELDSAQPFRTAVRGERGTAHILLTNVASGKVGLAQVTDSERKAPDPGGAEWIYRRYYLPSDHGEVLEMMTNYYNATFRPTHEQAEIAGEVGQHALQTRSFERLFVGLLIPGMERFMEAELSWRVEMRCTTVILAAERFRHDTGRLPDSIADLRPKYLPAHPADPYTGEPLLHRREPNRFAVYSTGPDRVDDGGQFDRERSNEPGTDLGVTLWDVPHRRQPPRPDDPPPPGLPP
jgi:hypothetical protein